MRIRDLPADPMTVSAWLLGGLTPAELWWHYLGLGGTAGPEALSAYLHGEASWSAADHDLLALALDERLRDLGLPALAPRRRPPVIPRPRTAEVGARRTHAAALQRAMTRHAEAAFIHDDVAARLERAAEVWTRAGNRSALLGRAARERSAADAARARERNALARLAATAVDGLT